MSQHEVLTLPKLGLTMEEGTIAEWRVAPGDRFGKGDVLFLVETDKIVNDVEAQDDGEVLELLTSVGELVAVGAPVARVRFGRSGRESSSSPSILEQPDHEARRGETIDNRRGSPERDRPANADRGTVEGMPTPGIASHRAESADGTWRAASVVERSLATRMTTAKRDVPHFYLSTEIEVDRLLAWRETYKNTRAASAPTITHLIVTAVARSMATLEGVNRVWRDGGIVSLEKVDVGIAVDTEDGLMVPVARDIGAATVETVRERVSSLVSRCRDRKLTLADTGGGAATVSNAGMHDVTQMISIITPGQSCVFGVGSTRRVFRADAAGHPALRHEIVVSLSMDHRVFDGVTGTKLLSSVKALIQHPERLCK